MEHTYPSNYPKDADHWAVRQSWDILDRIKPGAISDDVRCYLAGYIAGTLMKLVDDVRSGNFKEGK